MVDFASPSVIHLVATALLSMSHRFDTIRVCLGSKKAVHSSQTASWGIWWQRRQVGAHPNSGIITVCAEQTAFLCSAPLGSVQLMAGEPWQPWIWKMKSGEGAGMALWGWRSSDSSDSTSDLSYLSDFTWVGLRPGKCLFFF